MKATAVLAALPALSALLLRTAMAQHYGAVAAAGLDLLPRSYQAAAPALARRQSLCKTGTHPCKSPPRPPPRPTPRPSSGLPAPGAGPDEAPPARPD